MIGARVGPALALLLCSTAVRADPDRLQSSPGWPPQLTTESGWRLKLRGRVNYDTSFVERPAELAPGGLGFSSQFRRIRFGVEGQAPGGLTYKAELEFANGRARAVDLAASYRSSRIAPLQLTIGHIEPLNGFEQISSSRYTSTIERGEYNEAFGNTRRLGAYATWFAPHDLRVYAGIFGDTLNGEKTNNDLTLATRAFWAPRIGSTQLHIGANLRRRSFRVERAGLNYRARPFTANTDRRFVGTGTLAVDHDWIMGVEAMAIAGPFHLIMEGQRLRADVLNGDGGGIGRRLGFSPAFAGFTVEAGWFFTGESRGYREGLWVLTAPRRPLGRGGPGAISLNLRYDDLDLDDRAGDEAVSGGRQRGAVAALVWQPTNHARFTWQYTRGAVRQATSNQGERRFGFDMAAMRASWDF